VLGQTLQVTQRNHPTGEAGVFSSLEQVARRVSQGSVHPKVRAWSIEQLDRARKVNGIPCNTDRQRAQVLLRAVQKKLWVPDPTHSEYMVGAHLMACDRSTKDEICFLSGDCFAEGTLMLALGHEFVPVEHLKPGMKIWGLDRWSEVQQVTYKGTLSVDYIELNNGGQLKLTGDHHVYVLDCREHPMLSEDGLALPEDRAWRAPSEDKPRNGNGCSCDLSARDEKRIRVSELRRGMVLPTPERIAFGREALDPKRAYVEGLFIADGWAENYRFAISGQDNCPKEEQKREVQKICEDLGLHTRWHRKYLAVNDKEWALRMQLMGNGATNKHFLSLDLNEDAALASLVGVMADSGKNTKGEGRTFTTTSRLLALQVRVLHKMFGTDCGSRRIENHGGLGSNAIYRLGTRPTKSMLLRVRSIERDVAELPCWDIQTDDHRVYLPEHDVTVSQCDDLVILLGSCFLSVGLNVMVVGHAYGSSKNISHVLTAVRVDGRWHYADPTPDDFNLGECVEFSRERILSVPNIQVLCDDDVCLSDKTAYHPEKNDFVTEGYSVGVDGVPKNGKPKFYWLRKPTPEMLGQTLKERGEAVMDACLDVSLRADVSTAAARERSFGSGARCAADAYCATFAVPPGICSTVVGPVADAIANLWSGIFGGDPSVDCSKVSTFDPCHDCKLLAECAKRYPIPPGFPNYLEDQIRTQNIARCLSETRKSCYEAERKRIAAATLEVAHRAAADAKKKQDQKKLVASVGVGAAAGAALWYFWLR